MNKNEELEREIKKRFISTDVSYDKEFNIVYIHNLDALISEDMKYLQGNYEFGVSFGIFTCPLFLLSKE